MNKTPKPKWRKTAQGTLSPECWQAEEFIDKLKVNAIVSGALGSNRSKPYHDRFFKVLDCVVKYDTERFRSKEFLYLSLKKSLGYIDLIKSPFGDGFIMIEKSNAIGKASQEEFEKFTENSFDLLHEILGFRPESLLTVINEEKA